MRIISLQTEFQQYYQQICGYIRGVTKTEQEYAAIVKVFWDQELVAPSFPPGDVLTWLRYSADQCMLKYYSVKRSKNLTDDWLARKVYRLYYQITNLYPEFYRKDDDISEHDQSDTPTPSEILKHIHFIVESGYPHQILVFCLSELIKGWNASKIVEFLAVKNLQSIYESMIKEFSRQSDYPVFFVMLCFKKLQDRLHQKLKTIMQKNDSFTPKKMSEYLNWVTGTTLLQFYFGGNQQHDIADWCNKVKRRTVAHIADIC